MNHTLNELNERIISVGTEGSHIRNLHVYNITLPKMIQKVETAYSLGCKNVMDYELIDIMELNKNIPVIEYNNLIKTTYFYAKS